MSTEPKRLREWAHRLESLANALMEEYPDIGEEFRLAQRHKLWEMAEVARQLALQIERERRR